MQKKKLWIYLGFFGVLLAGFYWAISDEHPFTDAKLVVINDSIPDFSFTDQNGKIISKRNTEGKIYVAEYFFTTCKGICPKMNTNMRRVYDKFKDEQDFLILSHTCMPEVDSTPLLKKYEQKMLTGEVVENKDGSFKLRSSPADTSKSYVNTNWHFVTGNKSELYRLARQGYMIDNGKPDSTQQIENQFIHTQFFALVDRYGRVRGIYDGLKEEEIQKLLSDIPDLMKEKIDHARFLNGFSNTPN
jgi:protein SCO1/2